MAIMRKVKKNNFTVIDNDIFKDQTLSLKAKGLLCTMLSLPDRWAFSIAGLSKLSKDGRDAVSTALQELTEAGYFKRVQKRDGNKFDGVEYVVFESKSADSTVTEIPSTGIPITGNPPQLNTNKLNTNKSKTKKIYGDKGDLHRDPTKRPTLEEIELYIDEKGLSVDAKYFYEYFESSEWIDSKGNPVRNWKQKLITWSKNDDVRRSDKERKRMARSYGTGKGGTEQPVTGTRLPPMEESLL